MAVEFFRSKVLHLAIIYTIILLKSVGVRKLQVAILARSSREMSLTVHIVCHYILSRVRVSLRPRNFLYANNFQNLGEIGWPALVRLNDPATGNECQRSGPSRLGANE